MRAQRPLAVAASGLVAVLIGCHGPGTVVVSASQTWTDTGIEVAAGQELTVTAEGRVDAGPSLSCGPEGFANRPEWQQYSVIAASPHIGLIGRIGADGPPFFLGAAATVPVDRAGTLFLGVNDRDASNNRGSFSVTVSAR